MQAKMQITAQNTRNETIFEGLVIIAGKTFRYDLKFGLPVSEYMTWGRGLTIAQMRNTIPINLLSSDGFLIELTDREWEIFYYAVVPSALKIHNVRVLAGKSVTSRNPVILVEGGDIALKPEACKLLAQPKFGCQFLDETPPTGKTN